MSGKRFFYCDRLHTVVKKKKKKDPLGLGRHTSGIATKDYSVIDNDAKNLLADQKYKICCLPWMRRFQLKMCFGLDHYKCTGHTSNKSGFTSRYRSHKD